MPVLVLVSVPCTLGHVFSPSPVSGMSQHFSFLPCGVICGTVRNVLEVVRIVVATAQGAFCLLQHCWSRAGNQC